MTSPRPVFSLAQFLVGVAVLALPLALYAPVVREKSGRLSPAILAAVVAHGIELEAFVWLILAPTFRSWIRRRLGEPTTAELVDGDPGRRRWDRALLVTGPWLAVVQPMVGWGWGNRLPGLTALLLPLFLLAWPCNGVFLIPSAVVGLLTCWNDRKLRQRSALAVALLVLAIPCAWSIEPAASWGRRQLERELGVRQLARECLDVLKSRGKPGESFMFTDDEIGTLGSTAIRRLRPNYVTVDPRELTIELGGGFSHHRYVLLEDKANGRWILRWYSPEAGELRQLLTWPVGAMP